MVENKGKIINLNDEEKELSKFKEIVIFGYCGMGLQIFKELKCDYPTLTITFIDNDPAKHGVREEGMVQSLDAAVMNTLCSPDFRGVIVGSRIYRHVMVKALRDKGVSDEYIYEYNSDRFSKWLLDEDYRKKTTPLKKIRFEMDIADHCNLDCKYCSVFSPVAKERYYNFEQYKRDVQRMSQLFNGEAEWIHLIGGEPLLNKQIIEYMKVLRAGFPTSWLNIFTNGIKLFSMDEGFWDACRTLDFKILVTRYPAGIDYKRMKTFVENQGVELNFVFQSDDEEVDFERMKMQKLSVDPTGKQDIMESYRLCWEPNSCIKLRDGRLFPCVRAAVIDRYNEAFGTNCVVTDKDYIDIYKAESRDEILNFLASGPIPFCRYCDMRGRKKGWEWGHSTGSIEEWTYMGD